MPSVEELLALAEKAATANDWDHAADLLADAPKQVRVLDKRAFYLSRAKRYQEAREVLALLRVEEPSNFLWPHMVGYQYYEERRYADAVPWLIKAYKLNPTHLRNLYRLAQARRHQGELVRAKLAAAQVLKLWHALPGEAQEREAKTLAKASYLLARLQVDRDPRGALPLLEQAAAHDEADHDKHYMLGKTYRRVGQAASGLAALQRAQRIKPGRIYIELELADALREGGQPNAAAQRLDRALRGAQGWQAYKAARIALALGKTGDARRLLGIAARDRKVKRSTQYAGLKARVDAAAGAGLPAHAERRTSRRRSRAGEREQQTGKLAELRTGRVHHVRADRGFGFLVDDIDGERCYFKLRGRRFTNGQAVRFVRADTDRGPAANDIRPED
jgi:predicted Zn-dependent protease